MIPVCLAAAVVAAAPPVDTWCVDALQTVFPDAKRPPEEPRVLDLRGARGQRVTAQIVLRATQPGVRVTGVRCSHLTQGPQRIAGPDFTWAFVEYFHVEKNSTQTPPEELLGKAPLDIPDALSEAREIDLQPGRNQIVWVQVRIPPRAAAGIYDGTVTVRTSAGDLSVPIRLTVYDFTFPRRPRLLVTNWVNTGSLAKHHNVAENTEPYWQVVQRMARLMREHHQNVILTSWGLVQASRDTSGKLRFDFAAFDRWVETFLREGFEWIELSHMGGRENGVWEAKTFVTSDFTCRDVATGNSEVLPMEQWLPAIEEHLRAKGWLDRTMLHVADEPTPINVASWRKLSQRVHAAAPRLRRIDAMHVDGLQGDLEVWVPQLNYLEEWYDGFQKAQRDGVELWFYTCWLPQGRSPNRLLDYGLVKPRILHWFNYLTGATGYLHWGYNFWDVPYYQFAPGDNYIVYPGKETPRSSLRYEAMREGIEDHEYLCLLEDAARVAAKRLKVPAFDARAWTTRYLHLAARGFTDYTRKPAELLEARDAVAHAIVALRGRRPVLATATRDGGTVRVEGTTIAGARVGCGGATGVAGAGGRFSVTAPASEPRVLTLSVRHGSAEAELLVPVW